MKHSTKLTALLTACAVTATALLSGCSSSSDGSSKSAPLKLAVYPLTSPYFEYPMDEQELFEKYGANVELVEFAQYTDVIQALDTGSVDGSIMGITEAVAPIINNLGLEVVCMTDYSAGMDGIVAAKGIESVADLKGKTIATNIGTMNHMLLLSALEKAGLSESDVTITNMSEGDATAAIIGGSIDAASIFDPQMTKAAQESGGKIIFSSKDLPGELSDVMLFSKDSVENRSNDVKDIIEAWYDIQKQYNEDPAPIVKTISSKTDLSEDEFYELMAGLSIADLDYNKDMFANGGEKMAALITDVAEFLKNADCVESVPSADKIKAAINSKFIEELS